MMYLVLSCRVTDLNKYLATALNLRRMHFQEHHIIQTLLQFYAGTQRYLLNFRTKEILFSDFTSQTARSQTARHLFKSGVPLEDNKFWKLTNLLGFFVCFVLVKKQHMKCFKRCS